MKRLIVVALGGNSLLRGNQVGTIMEQSENVDETCAALARVLDKQTALIVTHGNGPQVGNILLRNEAGYNTYKVPRMPLDICVADSQGGIGYLIERQFRNYLEKHNINRDILTLVTQVEVSAADPAFKNPTKPVGPFFLKEEAELLNKANGWEFREDPRKRGWRRVVASPMPLDIAHQEKTRQLAHKGSIIITLGGGGIPVVRRNGAGLQGVDAVIDKDLASALLAARLQADEFIILTDVPKVCINYHKPGEKSLDVMSVRQAQRFLKQGEFAAGSMGPKIEAAIRYLKAGGKKCIINDAAGLGKPGAGTVIVEKL